MNKDSLLIVVSGPSGVGKGTICKSLLERHKKTLALSVSDTTRTPRTGEVDGVDYTFLTQGDFQKKIAANGYLEWAEVYGNYYGTPRSLIEKNCEAGIDTILEIDTVGAANIKESMPEAVFIFILPPSFRELEARLRGRKTDSEEVIERRLNLFREEIKKIPMYDYVLINDSLEQSIEEADAIITAEHLKFEHNENIIKVLED